MSSVNSVASASLVNYQPQVNKSQVSGRDADGDNDGTRASGARQERQERVSPPTETKGTIINTTA